MERSSAAVFQKDTVAMQLNMNTDPGKPYRSNSQKVRVITEAWVAQNVYCPSCGNSSLEKLPNNQPVADFVCQHCGRIFELKAQKRRIPDRVVDGEYQTMIRRIHEDSNPDFFFMAYDDMNSSVSELMLIPRAFITDRVIQARKPLSPAARRAGWTGCNILVGNVPDAGKIHLIHNRSEISRTSVYERMQCALKMEAKNLEVRTWTSEVLNCIQRVDNEFTLTQVYSFEDELGALYPENHNIHAKIRQQLQVLRDIGYIIFLGNGRYRKTKQIEGEYYGRI